VILYHRTPNANPPFIRREGLIAQCGEGCVGSRIGLVSLHCGGVWFPTEKASDPVRPLPLLFVAVARKPPAPQLKANHVRCWAGAAANSAVLACRSFHGCHLSPLTTVWKVC
jgi:hypothetical protein